MPISVKLRFYIQNHQLAPCGCCCGWLQLVISFYWQPTIEVSEQLPAVMCTLVNPSSVHAS